MDTTTEKQAPPISTRIPWRKMLIHQDVITPDILNHIHPGSGTERDPYLVRFSDDDPRDPMQFRAWIRWGLCLVVGFVTLSVAFISSAYASGIPEITADLGGSNEVNTLGLSLFVLGFVFGPFIWAGTSELQGRQYIFLITSTIHLIFNIALCFSHNQAALSTLRFLSGAFGAAPLTNAGGVVADCFRPAERGLAMTVFALVPLFGPVLGPIVGGFIAQSAGWRWLMGVMAMLSAVSLILVSLTLPETYAPVLLRRRAAKLSQVTGKVYQSAMENRQVGKTSPNRTFRTALSRPWLLMVHEPIIILLAVYQAVVFGTLYLTFAAYPIVYAEIRGWSQGISGLPFLGVMVGTLFSVAYQFWDNHRYVKVLRSIAPNIVPPESRLPACCVGGVAIPIGLFWFAWTNSPGVHWMASIAAGIPFGFGIVLITISSTNYLVDSYTIFAASALAVCVVGRAICGAAFPLFTKYMYQNLGIHWASSIPAFLSLACAPFPFIFHRYGKDIRKRCKYAAQAEEYLRKARRESVGESE